MNRNQLKIGYFFFFCLLIACNSDKDFKIEVIDENTGNTKEIQYFRKADSLATGKWQTFFPNGNLLEERLYENGKLNGVRLLYNESGGLEIEEHYVNDQFHGPYLAYFKNGEIRVKGQYINNEMVGEWSYYYENGSLKETVTFENNMENGPFEEFYPDGTVKAKGTYLEGDHEHGKLELFDSTGVLERIMECERGACRTIWKNE
jgi:antitoxin component YwqK of YwqJK toxin-antitoxin module